MAIARWMIGGTIGGLIGAAIWAMIGYALNSEVGMIAWGIGFLVGMGVRMSAPDTDGVAPGVTAVLLSIGSILLGKYLVVHLLVGAVDLPTYKISDPNTMIEVTANKVEEEFKLANRPMTPALKPYQDQPDPSEANVPTEQRYPKEVWAEANKRWQSLPQAQKDQQIVEQEKRANEAMAMLVGSLKSSAFAESFTLYDALWFVLASLTAFRIGSGVATSDD